MYSLEEIPKVIHYCWFGPNKMTTLQKKCIESWRNHLPEYNIIRWDEKRIEIDHPFLISAFKYNKWAFVADFVRFQKLYEYGGIYLDTDMFLLKPLDCFLSSKSFFGAEDKNYISGGIIGAVQGHPFLKKCLESYSDIKLNPSIDLFDITIPKIITKNFKNEYPDFKSFDVIIQTEEIVIYPSQYFYSLPYINRDDFTTLNNFIEKDSFAVHLWNESWSEPNEFQYLRKRKYWKGFKKAVQRVRRNRNVKFKYLLKILSAIKESFSKRTWNI